MGTFRRRLSELKHWILRPEWWRRERAATLFFDRLIAPGDLVFDIGAHRGAMTERFLKHGARVIALEPQRACAAEIRARIERMRSSGGGGASDVVIINKAVGAESGSAAMSIAGASQVSSLNPRWKDHFPDQRWDETIDVPVTTLDALIEEFGTPRFCKIDVEGFEPQVLAGLSRPIEAMSLEFTPSMLDLTLACLDRLEALGYRRINYCHHLTYTYAFESPVGIDEARQAMRALHAKGKAAEGGDLYAFVN